MVFFSGSRTVLGVRGFGHQTLTFRCDYCKRLWEALR